jgi:squalene-hopene/tetraprenyl-beta-curcumene cyclase
MKSCLKTTGMLTSCVFGCLIVLSGFCGQWVVAADAVDRKPLQIEPGVRGDRSLRQEVQHAIDKGLIWLEKSQDTNGCWSSPDYPAITGLALAAFELQRLGREPGPEPAAVKRGYAYLLSCIQPDGGIYRKDLQSYNTSISLMALALANRPEYRPAIAKAREFIVDLQYLPPPAGSTNDAFAGGIGYGKQDKKPDLSNTSWALEALYLSKPPRTAEEPKLEGADLNWAAAIRFIQCCQNLPSHNSAAWVSDDPRDKGGFVYSPGASKAGETNLPSGRVALRSYGSMSYAGLLSYIYADLKPEDPRVTAVVDWLRANFTLNENPNLGDQGLYYYYHTMAKALSVYGVDRLQTADGLSINWREQLALKLINLQHADGSWANDNGRWWEKDPALVTSYSLIALDMIRQRL